MKYVKDLNWLSAPAFFLIVGMLALHSKKNSTRVKQIEKIKTELSTSNSQKAI